MGSIPCFQVHMYLDSREKVTARYQVTFQVNSLQSIKLPHMSNNLHQILFFQTMFRLFHAMQLSCPSKREVMVFGSFKQAGTLLPKAPKGWGWRTALLFDELPDLLQNGALRVAAVVQLVWDINNFVGPFLLHFSSEKCAQINPPCGTLKLIC